MSSLDIDGLEKFRSELEAQIPEKETQLRRLAEEIADLKGKLEAATRLIGRNGSRPNDQTSPPAIEAETIRPSVGGAGQSGKQRFTPVYYYWPAILQSLIELGGSARGDEVIERVGKRLDKILTRADREMLPSGTDVRWRNRIQWQRYNMARQGLLRDDSPRGTWAITEKGREWLEDLKKKMPPGQRE